jgi:hypothetical protein
MGSSLEWLDIKYNETFEQELRGLERRAKAQPGFSMSDIKGILRNLYIIEGADYEGRGDLQNTILAATIAAYEFFINK